MAYPATIEKKVTIEYSICKELKTSGHLNPVVIEEDNSITRDEHQNKFQGSREQLIESITSPSRSMFLVENFSRISSIYNELNFDNPSIIESAFTILQSCVLNRITDVTVSKTTDHELLIYRKKNGEFSNIIIDEDGDISFIHVGKRPGTEKSAFFPKSSGFDFQKITSLL